MERKKLVIAAVIGTLAIAAATYGMVTLLDKQSASDSVPDEITYDSGVIESHRQGLSNYTSYTVKESLTVKRNGTTITAIEDVVRISDRQEAAISLHQTLDERVQKYTVSNETYGTETFKRVGGSEDDPSSGIIKQRQAPYPLMEPVPMNYTGLESVYLDRLRYEYSGQKKTNHGSLDKYVASTTELNAIPGLNDTIEQNVTVLSLSSELHIDSEDGVIRRSTLSVTAQKDDGTQYQIKSTMDISDVNMTDASAPDWTTVDGIDYEGDTECLADGVRYQETVDKEFPELQYYKITDMGSSDTVRININGERVFETQKANSGYYYNDVFYKNASNVTIEIIAQNERCTETVDTFEAPENPGSSG